MKTTRRQVIQAAALASSPLFGEVAHPFEEAVLSRSEKTVDDLLARQVIDSASPYQGGIPDATGLHHPGSASGLIDAFNAVFHHPRSKFHQSPPLLERMRLAAGYLERSQSEDGNIDNLITNFNSPPDTAFAVQNVAMAASIASKRGNTAVVQMLQPFLQRAARGMAAGGIHTPNHRWVLCAALAQIHDVFPDRRLTNRIGQWLAEGIDIDEDGQFDERSVLVYNPITDRALVLLAHKLKRPELLDPVRRNLTSALYLVHPDDEMVTEISRRQDRDQRGDIGAYWFPMHYLAQRDGNGQFAAVASKYAARQASLSLLLDMPELLGPLPQPAPLPDNYEKHFAALEMVRIRRGWTSATILLRGDSRFFLLRRGDAVISAVRFASAFFGRGQFLPSAWGKTDEGYVLRQSLSAPYFQPLDPPRPVRAGEWDAIRPERARTEVNFLEQRATVRETAQGFRLRLQAFGTRNVPVAVEIGVRGKSGLELDGLLAAPDATDAFLLPGGQSAAIRTAAHRIRVGPGCRANSYTQIRGAEPKLPGGSIYLTGFTPFDHVLEFECSDHP